MKAADVPEAAGDRGPRWFEPLHRWREDHTLEQKRRILLDTIEREEATLPDLQAAEATMRRKLDRAREAHDEAATRLHATEDRIAHGKHDLAEILRGGGDQ